jgi:outer membrane immunogenic protein
VIARKDVQIRARSHFTLGIVEFIPGTGNAFSPVTLLQRCRQMRICFQLGISISLQSKTKHFDINILSATMNGARPYLRRGGQMRRIITALMGAATLSVVCAPGARAADIPAPAPVYKAAAPAPMPDWTGWYLGVNAGADWARSDPTTIVSAPGTFMSGCPICIANIAALGNQHLSTSGFTGGVEGGYNLQVSNLLLGIEADFENFRHAGVTSAAGTFNVGNGSTVAISSSISTNWLFTARPRFGIVANNWLFYGTGGLAVTNLKAGWNSTISIGPDTESASTSSTKTGGTVGGGIETKLPGNWFVGAEYLYVHFGRVFVSTANLFGSATLWTDVFTHTVDLNANIVRLRLSKQF